MDERKGTDTKSTVDACPEQEASKTCLVFNPETGEFREMPWEEAQKIGSTITDEVIY